MITWKYLPVAMFAAQLVYYLYLSRYVGKRMDKITAMAAAIFAAQLAYFLSRQVGKKMDTRTAIEAAMLALKLGYFLSRLFGTR